MRSTEEMERAAARVVDEGAIRLSDLAKKLPATRRGKLAHLSTGALTRWILAGKDGVYLDGARGPGRSWLTSLRAFARFSAQLVAAEMGGKVKILATPARADRRQAEADAELDEVLRTIR